MAFDSSNNNNNSNNNMAYEDAARRLAELFFNNYTTPMQIHRITVHGIAQTKHSLLSNYINPVLKSYTLGEIVANVKSAVWRLNRLGIFENVDVTLDTVDGGEGDSRLVDVVLNVKEKGRFWTKTGTEVGEGEGNVNASMSWRNIFGGAEMLRANFAVGTRTSSAGELSFLKPVNGNPDTLLDISIFHALRNFQATSSHDESTTGAYAKYSTFSFLGRHVLGYDLAWRQICNIAENASLSVRHEAGHSLKSSISHTLERDTRDDPIMATSGYCLRMHSEFAGLGGSVNYVKNEIDTHIALPLGMGFALSTTLRAGLLKPFDKYKTRINDRFYIGGGSSLRGFKYHGVGPKDGRDALGGDAQWQLGVSLLTPLPKLSKKEWIKGHVWINAGNLGRLNESDTPSLTQELTSFLLTPPTVSIGTGVIIKHNICRLEFNFGVPVQIHDGDTFKKYFDASLGISFL